MLGVTPGGEVTAQPHGNGASRDFGQTPNHNQAVRAYCPRKPRGQGERNRQAIGHANNDVAHEVARREVMFGVVDGKVHRFESPEGIFSGYVRLVIPGT